MGANFNYVIVPKKIQNHKDLQKFYKNEKQKLIKKYGGKDFEGYSGDLASDNDTLEIKENLQLKLPHYKTLTKNSLKEDYDAEMEISSFIEGHAKKWGPSIAVKVNDHWVICGFYSD